MDDSRGLRLAALGRSSRDSHENAVTADPPSVANPVPFERLVSADGSVKYRFLLPDSSAFEAAFFRVPTRARPNIACVSTQLGCAVGCLFCATAAEPFRRNLTSSEIIIQVDTIVAEAPRRALQDGFEVSFMGMGEPLANLTNVIAAIRSIGLTYPQISRVSISTSGPSKRIRRLTELCPTCPGIHLQVSLHATRDNLRRQLVPRASDSIEQLLNSALNYHAATSDRVCLNYVLLEGLNDTPDDARWLGSVDPSVFYVKITQLNPVPALTHRLRGASVPHLIEFASCIRDYGVETKVFVGDGLDIAASCGQLAARLRPVPASADLNSLCEPDNGV